MNRRGFLRSLFASTATIVVAPACVLDELPPIDSPPKRTYFDMGGRGEDEIERLLREVGRVVIDPPWPWPLWPTPRRIS